MALNSGIKSSQELSNRFSQASESDFGFLIKIKNEEFTLESIPIKKENFDESCKFLESIGTNSFFFIIKQEDVCITFIPERAPIRDKMLYASSKGLLVKDLGFTGLKWDISSLNELTYKGLLDFKNVNHDKPYSDRELEMQKVKDDLILVDTSSTTRQGHITSLVFEADQRIKQELEKIKQCDQGGVIFVNSVLFKN